jgi:hypothetical protein
MSALSGLGPVELALLDAVDLLAADGEPVRCSDVLAVLDAREDVGPRYSWPALVDIGVPWRRHLPLVELHGNCGTALGDPPAEPVYVEVRLSTVGALALAAERGETGPLPLGIVEGSLYRGGRVPPFDPRRVVGALLAASSDVGGPALPTGGAVVGDLEGLLAGAPAHLLLRCTIRPEGGRLVITEVPLGAEGNLIVAAIEQRSQQVERDQSGRGHLRVRRHGSPVVDVRDETSSRDGIRIVVDLDPGADLQEARDWLLDVWPVTIGVDARLPAPMADRLGRWDRGDGSGLRALADQLGEQPTGRPWPA